MCEQTKGSMETKSNRKGKITLDLAFNKEMLKLYLIRYNLTGLSTQERELLDPYLRLSDCFRKKYVLCTYSQLFRGRY